MTTNVLEKPVKHTPILGAPDKPRLADFNHPLIQIKARLLTAGCVTDREKFLRLHEFVREEIPFGFVASWDKTKASEVLEAGMGTCNMKTTLLLALCKAVDIPARVHFGSINLEIQRGFFPPAMAVFVPKTGAHSYLEVELEGLWRKVDTYIIDGRLCNAARRRLIAENRAIGYGIAMNQPSFFCESSIDGENFVQMGAIIGDYGTYEDPMDFFDSPLYPFSQRLEGMKGWFFRRYIPEINQRIEAIRKEAV